MGLKKNKKAIIELHPVRGNWAKIDLDSQIYYYMQ